MPDPASLTPTLPSRPVVAGKFFRRDGQPWTLHGLTYGPFDGPDGLPHPDRVRADLAMIAIWGANTLRLFTPPPDWFLDLCGEHGLSVMAGVAWTDHVDFLTSSARRREAVQSVRQTARRLAGRREVIALMVGNEIQAPLVRWLGPPRVLKFLELLIDTARAEAPDLLFSYANYPTTEYLQPANADFTAFNVYLEDRSAFDRYVARLQNIAGDAPLVISEFGVDAKAAGDDRQAEILTWQRRSCLEAGIAGNVLFAFTDEWHRGGQDVTGWHFGLTTRDRSPRRAWRELAGGPPEVAELLPPSPPRVSVLVCTRNGAHTLAECLASLERLAYPNYEVIVVDDGSTQDIAAIVQGFPSVRYIRQDPQGLSVARNTAAAASTGEILAYTDDDCIVEPAWLTHLVRPFARPEVGAAGGPNIPPAPVNRSQACVIAAPGGPAHVLLTDTTAEHVPGCNMAVRRRVFDELEGFRPKYHAAGDDVDFCWRLLEKGHVIGFNAAAMVWHYRRFTVKAFLKQQTGYGKAEALLTSRHSSRFGQLGGARWKGVVYQTALRRLTHHASRIYSGVFGTASYQAIYGAPASEIGWLITGFPWWLLTAAVALNALWLPPVLWLSALMAAAPLLYTLRQALRLPLAREWRGLRSRLLLWFLLLVQPVLRGWSRFAWNVRLGSSPGGPWLARSRDPRPRLWFYKRVASLELWSEHNEDRHSLLEALTLYLRGQQLPVQTDDGWRDWDLETCPDRWWRVRLACVTEYHGGGKCLTRVRIASRASLRTVLTFGSLVLTAAVLAFLPGFHVIWALGLLFISSLLFESRHHRAVTRAANMVVAAAAPAGFLPVGDEDPQMRR